MRISRRETSLLVRTPAKINLYLKVLGKRADGFHDLETLMASVRLYDELTFSPNESGKISLSAEILNLSQQPVPTDDKNLIIQAANLLKDETDYSGGVDIHVTKRIPSEAGLGGGSSDAAATLSCLNRLWELNLSSETLHRMAAKLGSDVNFFLDSNLAAVCTGRGEQVTPYPLRGPLHFVLVKPGTGLSTAKVFETLNLNAVGDESRNIHDSNSLEVDQTWRLSKSVSNALEQPARLLNPQVDAALNLLSRQDVLASGMSGSGTACFGICRTRRHAQVVASRLRAQANMTVWALCTGV